MSQFDNLRVSKIILITGGPGARKDFVGGWLGLCNGFVRTHWRIDPLVGYSWVGWTGWTISSLLDRIERGSLQIDSTSNQTLAITGHVDDDPGDINENLKKLIALTDSGHLTIAGIDLQHADMTQYHWDRLVKVHLCLGMEYNRHYRHYDPTMVSNLFETSEIVTDDYAVAYIENKIKKIIHAQKLPARTQDNHWPHYKKLTPVLSADLDYAELFKSGGSYYLCDMLGTTAPERAHNYWDAVLPFADAPESCTAFGRTWNKSMIIK